MLVPVWSRLVLQSLAATPSPRFQPVWSEWIIAETWRVLTRRWLVEQGLDDEKALTRAANRMLRRLLRVMRFVSLRDFVGTSPWPGLRDAEDEPIWATAVLAEALYVVSHDIADFPPLVHGRHVHAGIEYLTAIEFVADVIGADAAEVFGASLPAGAAVRSGRVP